MGIGHSRKRWGGTRIFLLVFCPLTLWTVASPAQSLPGVDAYGRPETDPSPARATAAAEPETVRTWEIRSGLSMDFSWIPPGTLAVETRRGSSRSVGISRGYWLGRHEVTVGAFRAFVEETGYVTEAENEGRAALWVGGGTRVNTPGASWRDPGFPQNDDHPVVCVTWNDAQAFCEWAGARLPSADEWEYAYRGGRENLSAGELTPRSDFAWLRENAGGSARMVGRKEPTGWGLRDMLGNVWEWSQDSGPRSPAYRLVFGGSWVDRSYHLGEAVPTARRSPRERLNDLGFRVVLLE